MDVYVARQPIFDVKRNVVGYEVLYRGGMGNSFNGIDGDEATSKVIVNAFQNFGVSKLTNDLPAFINFTEKLIYEEVATLFSPDLMVIEILETVRPTAELLSRCRELKAKGYKLALDDFLFNQEYLPLIEIADIIKVDFMNSNRYVREECIKKYKRPGLQFLAEKIETQEEFQLAKSLGYEYFQGYFFSKPQLLATQSVQPLQVSYLRLMNEVNKVPLDVKELVKIISQDLGLTYSILKLINSPMFGLRQEVQSVERALLLLGEKEIKKWITLISLKGLVATNPTDLIRLSMHRAHFCELLGQFLNFNKEDQANLFLMGLFSLIDVILDTNIQMIFDEISINDKIKRVLTGQKGPYYFVYQLALAYEKAEWDQVILLAEKNQIDATRISDLYLKSIDWTSNFEFIG